MKTDGTIQIHVDIAVTDDCKNPDSYGEICVMCNRCGRFDKGEEDASD